MRQNTRLMKSWKIRLAVLCMLLLMSVPGESYASPWWTPSEIPTVIWYDAGDPGTLTTNASGRVSQWDDKSGNGRHATNAVVANQPTYLPAGWFNGLQTVSCENGSYFLRLALPVPSTQAVFTVAKPQISTFNCLFLNNQTAPGSITILPKAVDGSGDPDVLKVNGGSPAGLELYVNGSTNPVMRNADAMYDAIIADNTNGVLARFADLTVSTAIDFNLIGDTSSGWDARVKYSEIVIVDASTLMEEQFRVEGYLAWKWGFEESLPPGHPYKNEAPRRIPKGTLIHLY